jgi:hypothetical protein
MLEKKETADVLDQTLKQNCMDESTFLHLTYQSPYTAFKPTESAQT